ncbi:MAG: hypothetical protein KJZ57_06660 [Anaerolineales bacterium]|nr:hypothetical protein [Anaerolineales bacterium]
MSDAQKLLKVSPDKLKAFNAVLLDPDSRVMRDFLDVVAQYGTPAARRANWTTCSASCRNASPTRSRT